MQMSLRTRRFPKVLNPLSHVGERSREHGRRVSIGGRIGNRVIRSGCWRWMKMHASRMGIWMPIPPALPLFVGTMSFDIMEVVISVGIPLYFESRCLYPIGILVGIERHIDLCECAISPIPVDRLDQRMSPCSLIHGFEDRLVDRCCFRTHFSGSEPTVRSAGNPNRFLVPVDRPTHRCPLRERLQLCF